MLFFRKLTHLIRYLEEDPSTVVLEKNGIIEGYKLYIVEQWACSRIHPTSIITTYTGEVGHKGAVGVLGLPADENFWSPKLQWYFKSTFKIYARLQETPLGSLMVTNLNSFPSSLTIIPVPDGNVEKHGYSFIVNENLKRLGCSGRSGISLAPPAGATQAKFIQLYKTNQRVSLSEAVFELVKLCQIALVIFGKLRQEFADGCLCDMTETAITEWWTEIGSEHFNTEPSDGILGPTTVAGLLGLLIGARNRLSSCGAPVGKDSFDLSNFKRGIESFQKSHKLNRTRRLDRHTLDRLHKVTAKYAAADGWTVPKAVKSTVAELSGKGGEMVLGMVGRDKPGIGDIETLDIDHFISLAHGERIKWLWYGRSRRGCQTEPQSMTSSHDDQAALTWPHNKSETGPRQGESETCWKDEKPPSTVYLRHSAGSENSIPDSPGDRDHLHKAVFKSVSEKMNDARTSFGRIKDVVGLRGHAPRQSKDEGTAGYSILPHNLSPASGTSISPLLQDKNLTWKNTPNKCADEAPKIKETILGSAWHDVGPCSGNLSCKRTDFVENNKNRLSNIYHKEEDWYTGNFKNSQGAPMSNVSLGESNVEGEVEGVIGNSRPITKNFKSLIRRRSSISGSVKTLHRPRNENWYPRHMSFSIAEDAILHWEPIIKLEDGNKWDTQTVSAEDEHVAEHLKQLLEILTELQRDIKPWVEIKLEEVVKIDEHLSQDQANFQVLYERLMEQYQRIKRRSREALGLERAHIMEAIKEIEILGAKLEYEINTLDSRVHDVEDGVIQLEREVDDLEIRADKLEVDCKAESWTHWLIRSVTSIGTGSNFGTHSEI